MLHRLAHMIAIARISLVKDDGPVQTVQISEGQTGSDKAESITDAVPMLGFYGFAHNAPLKAETVVVRLNGDRSRSIAISTSHRPTRPKNLPTGDVMLYREKDGALGASIWLKNGVIQIDAAGGDIMIQNADTVTIKATTKVRLETDKLEVTGDIVSRADGTPVSLNDLRDAYHLHKHLGVTGSPGTTDHDA